MTMNFDNGQGLKFGLPGYGQGFDNPAGNVCQFQYVGLDGVAGTIKQGQALPSMPPDHAGSMGHHYRNMNIRHPQGGPVQNAFPIGVNFSMATSAQFSTMQPLDSFAMHQGYPNNPRTDMQYKIFNNWIGPPPQGHVLQGQGQLPRQQGQHQEQVPQSQGQSHGQASLPSFGHLWSHFQQQQIQKQQALQQQEPQQQQQKKQQQQQQQQFIGNQPIQNFPSNVSLIPNVPNNSINLQRGLKVSYQYSAPGINGISQARMGPSFSTEGTQIVAAGSQPAGCGENQISMVVAAAASNLAACSVSTTNSLVVSSGTTPVTNTTTTVTMTTCSSSPVTTTATSHSGVPVPAVGPVQEKLAVEVEKNSTEKSTDQCNGPLADSHSGGKQVQSKNGDGTFQIVKVPFGWRRTTEGGAVIYYSPSNTRLTSYHEVCKYLVSDGTCKCGIECPLQVEKVFNFDPFVNGKLWTVDDVSTEDLTKLCIHKRKIIAMATFQRSQSIPGGILSTSQPHHGRTKLGNSRTKRDSKPRKKPKNKVNATPYDGLLVSQLLAQRANSPQVLNHKTPQNVPMKNFVGDTQFSPPNHLTCNVMSNLGANTKLHHQSADSGDLTSPLSGDILRDPMDDLGPITCQVPAKLDFSAGCMLNNPAHRIASSVVAHDSNQVVFPAKNLSPQGPFSPDHLKNQQMLLQQHSPVQCVPASPSFVANVPNHMYGPNIPQHFQVPLNLQQQQQQQSGGMMFQTLMQVQNATGQRVPNPQLFDQSGMQASPVHAGPQQHQNLMFNSVYPQLSDLTWLDSGKPKTKRPRSKKDKQKLNSILDRTSPCPNVDVRQLPSETVCGVKSSVSFLENPSAFLAQQTALVRSSLNSSQLNMFHKPPPNNPSDVSSICINTTTTSVSVKNTVCSSVLADPSCINSLQTSETTAVLPDSVTVSSGVKVDEESTCENTENKKLPKDQEVEESKASEKVSSASVTQSDDTSNNSIKTVPGNGKSKSPKPKTRSNTVHHLNQSSSKAQPVVTSGCIVTATATGVIESPVFTTSNLSVGGLPQTTQPGTGDFPASSLLSAAAKAQGSQANPLGVVLGNPLQVNPGFPVNVSPEMAGVGGASLQDMLGKSGLNSLDQLCLSFGSGGLAPVMIPQNNILTGALPGFVNNPGLQGLPVNMCLPLGQPVMNSGVLNLPQNLLFGGLDPKLVNQTQQLDKSVNNSKSPSSDISKDAGSHISGSVSLQQENVNMANVAAATLQAETDTKNLTCTSTATVSSASNSQLLNNQFPFVTMNTPMPPISLPVVTNVTNSLSQVIPAVGMPQTILNQHPLAHLLSTVAVPAMNNSVVLTNPATQSCTQNITYLGLPVSGVSSATTTNEKSNEKTATDGNSERTVESENNVSSDKNETNEQVSVETQLQQEAPNVVLFPNLNMPMVQVLDGGSMIAGMEKIGTVPQLMLPGTLLDSQSQLCQSNPCAGLPLNLLQLQQMWNNVGGAGVPNINALQMQQLQTLQLQLLLQQLHVQGMQNLVNQMNLQGPGPVVPESGADTSSPNAEVTSVAAAEDEMDSEEQMMQDSAEEGEQDDDQSSLEDSTQDENIQEDLDQDVSQDPTESVVKQKICFKTKASEVKQHTSVRKNEEKYVRVKSISKTKPYVCTHSDSSGTKLRFVSVSCSSSVSSHSGSSRSHSMTSAKDSDGVKTLNKKQNKKQKHSSKKASPLCYDRVKFECSRIFTQDVSDDFTKSSPDRQSDSSTSVFEEESEKHKLAGGTFKNQVMGKKDMLKSESSEDLSSGISGKRTSDSSDTSVNDQALSDSGFTDCSDPSANESHEILPHHGEESTDKSDAGEVTEEDDLPLVDLKRKAMKRMYPDDHDMDVDENLDEYSMDCNSLQDVPCTGDLVWGQIRGFPLWPGKLVPESAAADVDLGPDYGEGIATVIVMWYGDHTFTRVEPERLKSWREGLVAHHKTRRRRKGRKMNSNLEAAIQEAMKDVSVESLPVLRTWRGRSNKRKKT